MSCWALIPVKAPGLGKTRLARALAPDEREALVCAMFRHVLATARACAAIDRICILGPSRPGLGKGLVRLPDSGSDLNRALGSALGAIATTGPDRVVVLPADLPCLTTADIDRLASLPAGVVGVAPDRHGTGTNALSLTLPETIWFPFSFGEESYSRHCDETKKLGLTVETILSGALEKDIDEPADLPDAEHLLSAVSLLRQPIAKGRRRLA
ncbi:MAG: 2-phospho-L-lactate guanylyltransferase [Novosphingobium sp.]|uniref:2-phospho-L-lactate guanylyltransferase n=1 Tax=Novosphingobium sp. TaxID=1874826 RepID=UPI0012C21659|nr:2-phospho-L-lactate guanylyltransferase [Novosphingobium sp.]MPS70554.1 2-phospho-L-lactate guanylyltransferase [Novosphingobium sp.]